MAGLWIVKKDNVPKLRMNVPDLLQGHTDGVLACYMKSLVNMVIQIGMRQPTCCK